jgi:hypothetical protein
LGREGAAGRSIRESEDLPSRIWNFTLADIGLPFGRIENGIPETIEPVSGIFILAKEPLIIIRISGNDSY